MNLLQPAGGEQAVAPLLSPRLAARARTAIVAAPRRARTDYVPVRDPAAGEVRIRLQGSGVCSSNLPLWEGRDWFSYPVEPGAPGHEGWGIVDALGPGADGLAIGDRVAALSYHAFAAFDFARAQDVVRIPDGLADKPFPGEPLGCAFNVFRRSAIEPGHTVAVVGVGFLGALLTRLAANAGARVIAISRRTCALEIAAEFGAAHTIRMDEHARVLAQVKQLTGGRWCERVIEAVGTQWPLSLAAEITAERGRLVIAGFHQDGPREVDMQLWNWRGLDVVNAHERDPATYVRGMREAAAALERGELDPTVLYTHLFPLEELDIALDTAAARPDGFMKALICP